MPKEDAKKAAPQQDNSLAIISMVLGVVSLTGPGLLFGIPAIVLAIIALRKKTTGRGLAITGLVTGIVSTILSMLFCFFIVLLVIWGITAPQDVDIPNRPPASTHQEFNQSQT
jgi:thiamine transporter ThiT